MLSILRCKEIKEEVLQRFNNEFNGIAKKATHVKIPEFGSVVSEILKGCMSEFNRRGGRYSKDVVDNTVEELKKQILD